MRNLDFTESRISKYTIYQSSLTDDATAVQVTCTRVHIGLKFFHREVVVPNKRKVISQCDLSRPVELSIWAESPPG